MSYIIPPSAASVEVMKFNKTGSSNLTNLPYNIETLSIIDVGSSNWTELTDSSSHPSMSITSDFGIKFEKTGYYRIDWGVFLYGLAPVSGTTGVVIQYIITTDTPDPTKTGYWDKAGAPSQPTGDIGYKRFDLALANNQVLAQAPDFNVVIPVDTAGETVYLFVKGEGLPTSGSANMVVRHFSGVAMQSVAVTRVGDL